MRAEGTSFGSPYADVRVRFYLPDSPGVVYAVNPYEEFDAAGLEYTAGEHQGHDQSMMAALIHAISPRLIIEVGSWKGGSAIQMASVVRRRGWGCSTKILCVDTWLGTSTENIARVLTKISAEADESISRQMN